MKFKVEKLKVKSVFWKVFLKMFSMYRFVFLYQLNFMLNCLW